MKIYLDTPLIHALAISTEVDKRAFLKKAGLDTAIFPDDQSSPISLDWPSLLECLDLGNLFESFPTFTPQSELFQLIISLLPSHSNKNLLIEAYDHLFVECLTFIKALPEINPTRLLEEIAKKQKSLSAVDPENLFIPALARYEKLIQEHPRNAMHDLILYLAWDRACINLAIVFEHLSPTTSIETGLNTLKDCLIESFQHITTQGRIAPSFFRCMEALYAYQMRDEHLQLYTDEEWLLLCQSASILQPRNFLTDAWHIDAAITHDREAEKIKDNTHQLVVVTIESEEKVKTSRALANYMMNGLKTTLPEWPFTLSPVQVICLKREGDIFEIDAIIHS